jgi:hypothetical protein
MSTESDNLLRQLEIENGGEIKWKTYAFLMSRNDRTIITKGGLLYIVDGVLIFEDFESDRPIYRIIGTKRNAYQKTKLKAQLNSIVELKPMTRSNALKVLRGTRNLDRVKPPRKLQQLIDRTVHAIRFDDESIWFCEMYDTENLNGYLSR